MSRAAKRLRSVGVVRGAVLAERLEARQMMSLVTLTNGSGAGAVVVDVDGYGAFGEAYSGRKVLLQNNIFGQNLSTTSLGEVAKSSTYFSPVGAFLTEQASTTLGLDGKPVLDLPDLTPTTPEPSTAISNFVLTGTTKAGVAYSYAVRLVQTLSLPQETSLQGSIQSVNYIQDEPFSASTLTQTYTVTNLLGTPADFSAVRYLEPTHSDFFGFSNVYNDTAGLSNAGQALYVVKQQGFATFNSTIAVRSAGGAFVGGGVQNGPLESRIEAAGRLPPTLYGLLGDDGTGYSTSSVTAAGTLVSPLTTAAMAQEQRFTVGPRESVVYTTVTQFSQGVPEQALRDLTAADGSAIALPANQSFALSLPTATYTYPRVAGVVQPLNIVVDRIGGRAGAATAVVGFKTQAGLTLPTSLTVAFADGETSKTVTVQPVMSVADPRSVTITVGSGSSGVSVTEPGSADVLVIPEAPTFRFDAGSAVVGTVKGQADPVLTIRRAGNLNGPASVAVTVAGGTGVAGVDFTAPVGRVDFVDGQSTGTVTLPVLRDAFDAVNRTVVLRLAASTPGGGAGVASVAPTDGNQSTVTITDRDVINPTVTGLTTTAGARGIVSVRLTFSEALLYQGGLSPFVLESRGREGAFGSGATRPLGVSSVVYDPTTLTVTLTPARPLAFNKSFGVTVLPDASLTDLAGNTLLQTPTTGVARYKASFARGTRVTYVDRSGDTVKLAIRRGQFELVRGSDGEALVVRIAGDGVTAGSVFTATATGRRGTNPATTIGQLLGGGTTTLQLASNVTVPGAM